MAGDPEIAEGWLLKAESDLAAARILLAAHGPYDAVCFHAQQAAEKALKALIASRARVPPKTHNLEDLEIIGLELVPSLDLGDVEVALLTPYAVELRYDAEFWPEEPEAHNAIEAAAVVVAAIRPLVMPAG